MGKIRILSDNMINLVSAGEVIERPSSVVKELIENSIDAKATKISIEIKNGGKKLIHVSDNGVGISKNDVRLAFISHATSKIYNESDLEKILTLGFRGEALPSICTISKLDMFTCSKDEPIGSYYRIEGGNEIFLKDCSPRCGSSIMVHDLFFNTPARMKFLKKDITEGNYIHSLVDHMILSHPNISFKFIRNGKNVVSSIGDGKIESAVLRVFGKDFLKNLIKVNYRLNNLSIYGFISNPSENLLSSKSQNFFINGRWIKDKIISNAIEFALDSECQNKKVSCILYIDIPANLVDVNVHPAKMEARFADEKVIFELVYNAIKDSIVKNRKKFFEKIGITSEQNLEEKKGERLQKLPKDKISNALMSQQPKNNRSCTLSDVLNIPKYKNIKKNPSDEKNTIYGQTNLKIKNHEESTLLDDNLKIIGEIFDCFFLFQHENKLILVDKHAAHERIIFENLVSNKFNHSSQILVESIIINFSKIEYDCIIDNIEKIKKLGYKIEDFGMGNILIREIPVYMNKNYVKDSLCQIVEFLLKNKSDIELNDLKFLYSQIACKYAIKSGKLSSPNEVKSLIKSLIESKVSSCPHGRPVYVCVDKDEIYKRFLRKK